MLTEISNIQNMEVITDKGLSLGIVEDAIVDLETAEVYELLVTQTNPDLVDDGANVGVPYRWIQSISKVILLKHFPGRIKRRAEIEIPALPMDGRKRKLRVMRKEGGEGGLSRTGWR